MESPEIMSRRKKARLAIAAQAATERRPIVKMIPRPNSENFKAKRVPFEKALVIGRCDLQDERMDDGLFPSVVVSRHHAQIMFNNNNNAFFLKDDTSTNGTYLNTKRLQSGVWVPLTCYDIVMLGSEESKKYRPIKFMVELDPCMCANHDTLLLDTYQAHNEVLNERELMNEVAQQQEQHQQQEQEQQEQPHQEQEQQEIEADSDGSQMSQSLLKIAKDEERLATMRSLQKHQQKQQKQQQDDTGQDHDKLSK